jgi:predicted anti-sigma-YlaC factor YlaD
MNNDIGHIPEYELERYYRGDSDPLEMVLMQEHLSCCSTCRNNLEEAGRFVRALWAAAGRDETGCIRY